MSEALDLIRQLHPYFWGKNIYFLLYVACLALLLIFRKKWKNAYHSVVWYSLFVLIVVIYNPIATRIIVPYLQVNADFMSTYVRIYLILPVFVTIAYVLTEVVTSLPKKWMTYLALAAFAVLCVIFGSSSRDNNYYIAKESPYKINGEILQIADTIKADAYGKRVRVYMPAYLDDTYGTDLIRQGLLMYSSDLVTDNSLPYVVSEEEIKDGSFIQLVRDIESSNEDQKYFCFNKDEKVNDAMLGAGYQILTVTDKFTIFKSAKVNGQNVWTVTSYPQANGAQGMCYSITDLEGHLILVDGGFDLNSELLLNLIMQHNSHVDAWIITHPHQDHVSAFNNLMNSNLGFDIGTIYTIDLDYDFYESVVNNFDGGFEYYTAFLDAIKDQNVHYVHTGDQIDLCGLQMDVLNAYDIQDSIYEMDPANNGSMMFKLSGKEKSMLFCADVTALLENRIKEQYGDKLKADYLQVAHHGIGGTMSSDFDVCVDPEVAFMDLPGWVNIGDEKSGQIRQALIDNGTIVYNFDDDPKSVEIR